MNEDTTPAATEEELDDYSAGFLRIKPRGSSASQEDKPEEQPPAEEAASPDESEEAPVDEGTEPSEEPSYKPDYANLANRVDELAKKVETTHRAAPGEAPAEPPAQPQSVPPPRGRVDLSRYEGESFKRQLADVAKVDPDLGETLKNVAADLTNGLKSAYSELDGLRVGVNKRDVEMATERKHAMIEAKHPGWQATASSEEFRGWLSKQRQFVQNTAAHSTDPTDVIDILDLYSASVSSNETAPQKTSSGPAAKRAQARKSAASKAPPHKVKAESPAGSEPSAFDEDYTSGWDRWEKNKERRLAQEQARA